VFDKSIDLARDTELDAFPDYSQPTALFWVDILVFCAMLAAVAACF
jgi:hypothetical protein